jgi:hypothetical protein
MSAHRAWEYAIWPIAFARPSLASRSARCTMALEKTQAAAEAAALGDYTD